MECFQCVPAVAKHPLYAACRNSRDVDSPTGVIQAFFLPPQLLRVSPHNPGAYTLGNHTLKVLAELGGTR